VIALCLPPHRHTEIPAKEGVNLSARLLRARITSPVVSLYGERQAFAFGRDRTWSRRARGFAFSIKCLIPSPQPSPYERGSTASFVESLSISNKFTRSKAGIWSWTSNQIPASAGISQVAKAGRKTGWRGTWHVAPRSPRCHLRASGDPARNAVGRSWIPACELVMKSQEITLRRPGLEPGPNQLTRCRTCGKQSGPRLKAGATKIETGDKFTRSCAGISQEARR
jgi:hypothetical protein